MHLRNKDSLKKNQKFWNPFTYQHQCAHCEYQYKSHNKSVKINIKKYKFVYDRQKSLCKKSVF